MDCVHVVSDCAKRIFLLVATCTLLTLRWFLSQWSKNSRGEDTFQAWHHWCSCVYALFWFEIMCSTYIMTSVCVFFVYLFCFYLLIQASKVFKYLYLHFFFFGPDSGVFLSIITFLSALMIICNIIECQF